MNKISFLRTLLQVVNLVWPSLALSCFAQILPLLVFGMLKNRVLFRSCAYLSSYAQFVGSLPYVVSLSSLINNFDKIRGACGACAIFLGAFLKQDFMFTTVQCCYIILYIKQVAIGAA